MNSPPILEPILVVGLGCSRGGHPDFYPWPCECLCAGWEVLTPVFGFREVCLLCDLAGEGSCSGGKRAYITPPSGVNPGPPKIRFSFLGRERGGGPANDHMSAHMTTERE